MPLPGTVGPAVAKKPPHTGGKQSAPHAPPIDSSSRHLDFSKVDVPSEPALNDSPSPNPPKPKKVVFQRGLGEYPKRERKPIQSSFRALHAKPSTNDPSNRREALAQDMTKRLRKPFISNVLPPMSELGISDGSPVELFKNNKGARDLAYNPEHHSRTKHVDHRHFYVRELVENKEIVVPYVKTDDNLETVLCFARQNYERTHGGLSYFIRVCCSLTSGSYVEL